MDKLTILDLLHVVKWSDVKKSLKFYYPSDKNDYTELFNGLKNYKCQEHSDKDEYITIHAQDNLWYDAPLTEKYEDQYYSMATNKYSMSLRRWSELINIPISEDTLSHYTFNDIVAHFIWEITFYGNEKDIEKIATELEQTCKNIKAGKGSFIPYDEFKNNLEKSTDKNKKICNK